MRRIDLQLSDDVRRMRLDANVSLADLARATGISASYLGRVEAGKREPSLAVLVALGVALGADLSLRYFEGSGPRIHDQFQAPMVEALIRSLHPRWHVELEAPVTQPSRGVIDAVLRDVGARLVVATEVHSDLRRIEQQIRWGREKSEGLRASMGVADAPDVGVSQLLVLRSTVRTRQLIAQYEATFRAGFPAPTASAVAALTGDAPWPGPAVVWMHLHGSKASLMSYPPNGVGVGR